MGLFDRLFGKKSKEQSVEKEAGNAPQEPVVEAVSQGVQESTKNEERAQLTPPFAGSLEEIPASQVAPASVDFFAPQDVSSESADSSEESLAVFESVDQVAPASVDSFAPQDVSSESVDSSEESLAVSESVDQVAPASVDFLLPQDVSSESVDSSEESLAVSESVDQVAPDTLQTGLTQEQEAQTQRTLDMMAQYYAAKDEAARRVKEAEEKGISPAIQTRPQEDTKKQETVASTRETEEEKYSRSLKKTRTGFGAMLNQFFANFRSVDEEFFEELEELLILSDVGVTVASKLVEELHKEAKLQNAKSSTDLQRVIIETLVTIYDKDGHYHETIHMQDGLTVMLFVGVNGVGKTTSIGKLAYKYKQSGKKVMLVAADTFRAGAVAQLVEWGRRVDVPVVTGKEKSDPASVVFDGLERAVAENVDILLIDTAGRLQNKDNLMAELEKIGRIIKRVIPSAPHETLLAVDASTGQNALVQAKEFSKITPLTGLVLTKIDGTARGGVVLAIREELDIPVKFIGFGEKIDDIGEFKSEEFIKGLLQGLV